MPATISLMGFRFISTSTIDHEQKTADTGNFQDDHHDWKKIGSVNFDLIN